MADNNPTETPAEKEPLGIRIGEILVPGIVAVGVGVGIVAVAVTWGAAEAAVGVGAAYLVYAAITSNENLSGSLAVRLLTAVFRRPPPEGAPAPRTD